jgi:hypothetical protein
MKSKLNLAFIIIIFIAININAFGQQQWGVKVSGGISRIYGQLERYDLPSFDNTSSFSPSFQAGIYYKLPMSKNTSLGAEILYSKIEGEQDITWDYQAGDVENQGSTITNEDISYLSLPVYYGITFKRLTISGGVQFSYLLSSSGTFKFERTIIIKSEEGVKRLDGMQREFDDLDIKDIDFGPRAGFIYRLSDKLSMEGMFYYGLNNINQLPSSEETLKVQQMTLGVRYALWTHKSNQ